MIPYTGKMLVIMTIISLIFSLIIAGIVFGIWSTWGTFPVEFLSIWLYSFIGWVTFLILAMSLANCVGKRRFRSIKSYIEKNEYEGGQAETFELGQNMSLRKMKEIKDQLL